MRETHRIIATRLALLVACLSALSLTASGQSVPSSMDHGGMAMSALAATTAAPADITVTSSKPAAKPTPHPEHPHPMHHRAISGMDHQAMPGMDHAAPSDHGSMPGMTMAPMQGDSPPADARSPDYSDGMGHVSTHDTGMHDSGALGMLLIDQLEAFHGHDGNGQSWEAEGWYGNDADKLWLRTEGERSGGRLEDGEVEALWNHAVATFWSTQWGVRHDFGVGPRRDRAALGVQGLSPYWFEIQATAYVGPSGRTAGRLRADYELMFTQRLILQPELEVNLHGRSDPARGIGSGLSDAKLGLRLRYEIRREFAPYIGVVWTRRFGATADFARGGRQAVFDRQWVAGLRIWF
jgi:copper resistance protein B